MSSPSDPEALQAQINTLAWLHAELVHNLGVMSARFLNPAANRMVTQRLNAPNQPQPGRPGMPAQQRRVPQPFDPQAFARQQAHRQRAIHIRQIQQAQQANQAGPEAGS